MAIFNRRRKSPSTKSHTSEVTLTDESFYSRPTTLRFFTAFIYFAALVFLVLVCIGNINDSPVIRDTYFLKIDLANVIPETIPNAVLINTLAQSIGLHDFYQVGLWNYCEGYVNQGITSCSSTKTLYWFNPVEIILSQLLVGASIALPADVVDVLTIVRIASHWMFASFITGTILTFLCIFIAPMGFSKKPRWSHRGRRIFLRALPITIITFLALLFTAGASVIATVMFVIFRNTFQGAGDLNVQARLGPEMLTFMWVAVGLNLIGVFLQIGTCCGVCCCTGRKKAVRQSRAIEPSTTDEK